MSSLFDTWSDYLSFVIISFDESNPLPLCKGVLCTRRLAGQSPLTGYEPKSLIEVNSEHTIYNFPSRKGSLDTNLDDFAATVEALEFKDTTDNGRLTSQLLSQACEVSANPSAFLRHIEAWRNPGVDFQASGNGCRKVKEFKICRVCKILKWKGKEFCPKMEILTTSFSRKADQACQGDFAAQTTLSQAHSEMCRRECCSL